MPTIRSDSLNFGLGVSGTVGAVDEVCSGNEF
jgi:uncharacterized protein GlcG (DUF336 family)